MPINQLPLFEQIIELKNSGRFVEINQLIPYTSFVKLELQEGDEGLLTILRQTDSNIGNTKIPAVHGGVVGGLLEQAAVMEVIYRCDMMRFPKIINISVDYLRPVNALKDTYARAMLIKQGRSVSNVRVEAWQDDSKRLVAAAHAHFLMK